MSSSRLTTATNHRLTFLVLVFSYRKPDLSPADFKAHHETSHVPLLQSLTGDHFPLSHTRHYIDRPANDSSATVLVGTQADFEYDAFGELTFANSGGFQTFVGIVGQAEAAEKIAADEEKF